MVERSQRVGQETEVKGEDSGKEETLAFHRLLSYADAIDWALMALGTLGSVVHGMAQPIGYLLLGKALNAFGNNIDDTHAMANAILKVCKHTHIYARTYMYESIRVYAQRHMENVLTEPFV